MIPEQFKVIKMSLEENKAVVRRIIYEFVNTGNTAVADETFSADLVDHRPGQTDGGREDAKRFIVGLRQAFPDLEFKIEHLFGEGDKVVVHVVGPGTHTGEFMGISATGKKVILRGTTILRLANGKVVERWNITDLFGVLTQLGAKPTL